MAVAHVVLMAAIRGGAKGMFLQHGYPAVYLKKMALIKHIEGKKLRRCHANGAMSAIQQGLMQSNIFAVKLFCGSVNLY